MIQRRTRHALRSFTMSQPKTQKRFCHQTGTASGASHWLQAGRGSVPRHSSLTRQPNPHQPTSTAVVEQALTQYKHIEVDPIKARRIMAASTQGTALPYVPVPGTRAELEIKMEALKALGMGDQAEEIERMFNARR